jgi:hypothetical protein
MIRKIDKIKIENLCHSWNTTPCVLIGRTSFSESYVLIGQNLMAEPYVMIGQS